MQLFECFAYAGSEPSVATCSASKGEQPCASSAIAGGLAGPKAHVARCISQSCNTLQSYMAITAIKQKDSRTGVRAAPIQVPLLLVHGCKALRFGLGFIETKLHLAHRGLCMRKVIITKG